MLRTIAMSFFLMLLLLVCGCSKDATDPPPPEIKVDTTSHNFVWQIDTLGPLTTSLNDVVFLSDTEAWAVGRIQYIDSSNMNQSHGIAKWGGQKWTFETLERAPNSSLLDIWGIYFLDFNNVWLAVGSIYNWLGGPFAQTSWLREVGSRESARKIWADNSSRIFAVGAGGLLLSYDGSTWSNYSIADSMILKDVFGKPDSPHVWACGYASNQADGILLNFDETSWNTFWQNTQTEPSPYSGPLESLWYTGKDSIIVVGGAGVYWQDIEGNNEPRKDALGLGQYPYKVRGSAYNDIFIACARGRVWHFNGKTWQNYPQLENPNYFFYSVAVRKNKVFLVGIDISQGIQRLIIVSAQRI